MSNKKKILVVDDHPLVREWLANLINQEPDLEIIGEADNTRQALQLLERKRADIVIVDIWLEGVSGLELIKDIRALYPEVAAIVLTMHDEDFYAERVMRAGAHGYVMKRDATGKILDAIHTVLSGKKYFSAAVNAQMAQKLVQGKAGRNHETPIAGLSDRELEVFELLGRGKNTRQIAELLGLSGKTVQVYCGRIKEKLDLSNINELITHAVRWCESSQQR